MKKVFLILMISICANVLKAQQITVKTGYAQLMASYFDLKNALATDRAELSAQKAHSLLAGLKSFPVTKLPASTQQDWTKQAELIRKSAAGIETEKELVAQRKSFEGLASAMIKLARTFRFNEKDFYVQYCPMAKKSWLNEVEEIQNPFYGSKMFDCGEVTESIAKK